MYTILTNLWGTGSYGREVLRGIHTFDPTSRRWILRNCLRETSLYKVRSARVNGMVILPFDENHIERLWRALGRRIPTVAVSANWPLPGVPMVCADDTAIGRLAAEHLLELGFKNFASYGYPVGIHSTKRQDTFGARLAEAGMKCEKYRWMVQRPESAHDVSMNRRTLKWLQELPKPVGVLAANDHLAWELLEMCHVSGIKVPDEVAIIGVDNDSMLCELAWPSLSSISLPMMRIGLEAAALLDRLLSGASVPDSPILFPPTGVVVRQSTNILAIEDEKMAKALRFIRDHAHELIRVRDVLRAAPIARRTLERKFRIFLGRSIREEIERVRIETAKRLLTNTGMRVVEIAEASGFINPQRLFAAFRRATGTSPGQWRRGSYSDRRDPSRE